MASASRRNVALWTCALVVLATTPNPGTSQGEDVIFTVNPVALYLNHGRHMVPYTLTCSHPPGVTGGTKKLQILRKFVSDFELLAEVVDGKVSAKDDRFTATGNSDELHLRVHSGDCVDDQYLYQCRSIIGSVTRQKDLRINIFAITKAKLTVSPTAGGQMLAGVSYTFRCEALGLSSPELQWYVYGQERFLDLSPEIFTARTYHGKASTCLYSTVSNFTAEGEEVNRKLNRCTFRVKCEAIPQGTPNVGGDLYNDTFIDTYRFQLKTSQCNGPLSNPEGDAEDGTWLHETLAGVGAALLLLLLLLAVGLLILRSNGRMQHATARDIRRQSQITQRPPSPRPEPQDSGSMVGWDSSTDIVDLTTGSTVDPTTGTTILWDVESEVDCRRKAHDENKGVNIWTKLEAHVI